MTFKCPFQYKLFYNSVICKRKQHLAVHFSPDHFFPVVQKFPFKWGDRTLHSLLFTLSVKILEHEVGPSAKREMGHHTSLLSYCETQKYRILLLY